MESPRRIETLDDLENGPRDVGTGWPTPVSRFIGRSRELGEIEELFESTRLLTLIGPGGVGKTRLALELSERVRSRLRDGVHYAGFASITDPGLIEATLAAAFGVRQEPGLTIFDALTVAIGRRRVLLVLDDLGRLETMAGVVARLLEQCPNLHVLATSRAALRVGGEREYPVRPLALPQPDDLADPERLERTEAVALFVDRARGIDPRFLLHGDEAAAIAEICRRLDGLPLAIELAAARTRVLTPTALLARLDQRLPMLTAGRVDAPERHRTLRAAISWSFDLLGDDDRRALTQLATFLGPWTLEATEAVAAEPGASPGDVIAVLERLVDQSFVTVEAGWDRQPRFRMLETIREFVSDGSDDADLTGRHSTYFVRIAEAAGANLGGPDRTIWTRRLAEQQADIRAVFARAREAGDAPTMHRLAVAMEGYWQNSGEIEGGAPMVRPGAGPLGRRDCGDARPNIGRCRVARCLLGVPRAIGATRT